MGNPRKGTPAYKRKLKQSRDSKRARAAKRLLRRAGVKKKLLESTAWSNAEIDKWRRMSNQHMLAATGCKAQLKTTTAECASLHRKLERASKIALRQSSELKEMQQELHDLGAEQRDNKKELSKWHLYWGLGEDAAAGSPILSGLSACGPRALPVPRIGGGAAASEPSRF